MIEDMITQRTVATGRKQKGLYVFNAATSTLLEKETYFSSRFRSTNKGNWHLRLGHPNSRVLDYLCNKNFISFDSKQHSIGICSSFQMGKASKLPFPVRENNVNAYFS